MKSITKRKGKIRMWVAIIVILGVVVIALIGGILTTEPGRRELKNLIITNVNFKRLRNGTYIGEYKGTKDNLRDTKVQVTVSSGKVADIKVLKGALDKKGQPAEINAKGANINELLGSVINSQSLQVDVISGATLTSKAHLKAVENALEQAQTK